MRINASKGETGHICDFLGLTLDTQRMEARLPPDKLKKAIERVNSALTQHYMIKDELRSLLGFLSIAAKVVKPGRAFLRRLFTALGEDTSRIRIAGDMRLDLLWWQYFFPRWNGVQILRSLNTRDEISLWTDASGTWGMGGYYSVHRTPHSSKAGTLSRRSNSQILETTETQRAFAEVSLPRRGAPTRPPHWMPSKKKNSTSFETSSDNELRIQDVRVTQSQGIVGVIDDENSSEFLVTPAGTSAIRTSSGDIAMRTFKSGTTEITEEGSYSEFLEVSAEVSSMRMAGMTDEENSKELLAASARGIKDSSDLVREYNASRMTHHEITGMIDEGHSKESLVSPAEVFSIRTSSRDMKKHINVKEMMTILHALRKWLPIFKGSKLVIYGDNQAVVNGLRNGSIRGPAMKPLRDIAMLLALHDIVIE